MKKYLIMSAIALAMVISVPANASGGITPIPDHGITGNTAHYVAYARVVYVEAVYKETTRKTLTDCHDVTSHVHSKGDGNLVNEAIGGVIGGLIGTQIGKGSGKTAATIAGVIIGGTVANSTEGTSTTQVTSTVCDRTEYHTVRHGISHYNVTYEYGGTEFTIRELRRPRGDKKRMTIQITPYR